MFRMGINKKRTQRHRCSERSLEDLSLVKFLASKVTFPGQILLYELLGLI